MSIFLSLLFYFLFCFNQTVTASCDEIIPGDQSGDISLYPILEWTNYHGEKVSCSLTDASGHSIAGTTDTLDSALIYYPYQLLEPGTTYTFTVKTDEKEQSCTFQTTSSPMPGCWVEVVLGDVQKVLVWEKGQITQAFPCSGGTEETPSILGMYSMVNRGEYFYSSRVGEGAHYWIRIRGNYLFHGIPRDEQDVPIPGEEEKIGGPASHGCIRLHDNDAKWLYENIPDGSIVVIHPGVSIP